VISASIQNKSNEPINVVATIDASAGSDYEWDVDEVPVGWNHRADSPTFKSYQVPTMGNIEIHELSFHEDGRFVIDSQEVDFETFKSELGHNNLKQLLNPQLYIGPLNNRFENIIDNIPAPSESEDHYDPRYDRDDGDY
jgi:hypothetical protein